MTPLSDKELMQNVILAAKNALLHSDDFKDNFVSTNRGTLRGQCLTIVFTQYSQQFYVHMFLYIYCVLIVTALSAIKWL